MIRHREPSRLSVMLASVVFTLLFTGQLSRFALAQGQYGMKDLDIIAENAMAAGKIYLDAASSLPSDTDALKKIEAANAKQNRELATALENERKEENIQHEGADSVLDWITDEHVNCPSCRGDTAGVSTMDTRIAPQNQHVVRFRQAGTANNLPASQPDADRIRIKLMAAQALMNAASRVGIEDDEKSILNEIESSLSGATSAAALEAKVLQMDGDEPALKQEDTSSCPLGWQQHGTICKAGTSYHGPCSAEFDLRTINNEQRLAMRRFCKMSFPLLESSICGKGEFSSHCPSHWLEIGKSICQAPANYGGACDGVLDSSRMSAADKQAFATKCGARWPCATA